MTGGDRLDPGISGSIGAHRRLTRRAFTRGLTAFGAIPLVAGLLAACGGGSSASKTPSAPSATTSSGGASPTAGSQSATPAATTAATPVTNAATPSGTSQASTPPYTIEPAKHKGGQVVFGTSTDMDSSNPVTSKESNRAGWFSMVFEGLVDNNPKDGSAVPLLASKWEISPDGLTYSFALQSGVKWHDGQPFTSQDAKFTFDLIQNKAAASPRNGEWQQVTKIDVPDDSHITLTISKPNATFLTNEQGLQGIVPQHVLKDVDPAKLAQDPFSTGKKGVTIGTGPFMFDEWVKDDHCTLARNSSYWQSAPNLDNVVIKIVPSQTVITQQLKTGELDMGFIQPADYKSLQTQANVNVVAFNSDRTVWYGYQLDPAKSKLFLDKNVRQALFYALNRPQMVDAIEFGLAIVAVGMVTPISWAYDPNAIKLKYPYELNKAKSMLDAAGWKVGPDGVRAKNGQKMSFTLYTFSGSDALNEYLSVMQAQWKAIGVDCATRTEDPNALISRITSSHDFEMFLFNNGMGFDPDQSIYWACASYTGGFNMVKYCSPQVDKLFQEGLATTDQAKRKQIYTDLYNLMVDDLPVAFIAFEKRVVGVSKRFHNYFPNSVTTYYGSQHWWVDAS